MTTQSLTDPMLSEPCLTPQEASAYLRISPQTLRSLLDKGDIPCSRVGVQIRITRNALREYVNGAHQTEKEQN